MKPFNRIDSQTRGWVGYAAWALTPLACAVSLSAQAVEFQWGEVDGRANGSITTGAIWSAEDSNSASIFQGNATSIGFGSPGEFNPSGARNGDDGRLNFRKHDVVSTPTTLLGEVELNWQNYGVFMRGKAWYDYTLENKEVDFGHSSNGYDYNSTLDDSGFDDLAKFKGIALLDAYVFGDFDVANRPLHVRAGKQVVSWGEGLFFQNGINAINPVDVAALRRPGSQLKEALLPIPMLYGNFGLTESLSLEAFYQLKWRPTVLEGCGTFFAANDYIPEGCFGVPRAGANDQASYAAGQYIRRAEDDEARDGGQFGLALRYYADSIGTEFGAYAMNLHSRTPYASTIADMRPGSASSGWQNPTTPAIDAANGRYFAAFPEDVRIFGLSFSTNAWGTSIFGEYSYRPNQPVQLSSADLIQAFATNPAQAIGLGIPLPLGDEAIAAAPGSVFNGYDRLEISQLSLGFIKTIPRVLGAESMTLVGEAAAKYVHNLPSLDERRYNRTDQYGTDAANGSALGCRVGAPVQEYKKYACTSDGFTTQFSWGYRMRAQLNYASVFAGVNLTPYMAFGHDVKGWSYDSNFVEDRLIGTVGLRADYLQKYSTDLSWSGTGNTPYAATDRDFIALSFRMGF